MRLRVAIPALSLVLAACGSTAQHTARAPKHAQPTPRQADQVLILANYDGAVSVPRRYA